MFLECYHVSWNRHSKRCLIFSSDDFNLRDNIFNYIQAIDNLSLRYVHN